MTMSSYAHHWRVCAVWGGLWGVHRSLGAAFGGLLRCDLGKSAVVYEGLWAILGRFGTALRWSQVMVGVVLGCLGGALWRPEVVVTDSWSVLETSGVVVVVVVVVGIFAHTPRRTPAGQEAIFLSRLWF